MPSDELKGLEAENARLKGIVPAKLSSSARTRGGGGKTVSPAAKRKALGNLLEREVSRRRWSGSPGTLAEGSARSAGPNSRRKCSRCRRRTPATAFVGCTRFLVPR